MQQEKKIVKMSDEVEMELFSREMELVMDPQRKQREEKERKERMAKNDYMNEYHKQA